MSASVNRAQMLARGFHGNHNGTAAQGTHTSTRGPRSTAFTARFAASATSRRCTRHGLGLCGAQKRIDTPYRMWGAAAAPADFRVTLPADLDGISTMKFNPMGNMLSAGGWDCKVRRIP